MAANSRDISLATFNLFNLQRPRKAMYPRSTPYTEAQYAAKVAWAAQALRRLDADVVAFQELWDREALADILAQEGLAGNWSTAFIKEGAWDGIAVACAVRKPWEIVASRRLKTFPDAFTLKKRKRSMAQIRDDEPAADAGIDPDRDPEFVPSHEDEEIKVRIGEFSRSALQVSLKHGAAKKDVPPQIELFCAHLKSKLSTPLDDPEFKDPKIRRHRAALGAALSAVRRVSEAAALRMYVTEAMEGTDAPTVVLGDMNDGQFSDVVAILSGQPSFRVMPSSSAGKRSDAGLYTVATLQQMRDLRDVHFTYEHRNVLEIIDHVLVSEQFYDFSDKRLWAFRGMRVFNDHVSRKESAATDHGLVAADFAWKPAAEPATA